MNCIIGILLTSYRAEQVSSYHGEDIFKVIGAWYNSICNIPDLKAIVMLDVIPEGLVEQYTIPNIKFEQCYPNNELNAIDARWKIYKQYLEAHPEISAAFFTDIGDVVVLKNPFPHLSPGIIYTGDEEHFDKKPVNLSWDWMMHRWNLIKDDPDIISFREKHGGNKVLNAGLVGGHREILLQVVSKMAAFLDKHNITDTTIDMLALNVVIYTEYADVLVHGCPVNTVFWDDDLDNKICWFKHK